MVNIFSCDCRGYSLAFIGGMSVANIGGIHFPLRLYGVHVIAFVGGCLRPVNTGISVFFRAIRGGIAFF